MPLTVEPCHLVFPAPVLYPFACDFYIVSEDKFIEFQGHWTHGKKPFNPEEKDCQEKLNKWKEKAKTSKFY